MISNKETRTSKYRDGNISYIETICTISPFWAALYPNRRVADDGSIWIRTGENTKLNRDGSVQWRMNYDEYGNLIN